MEEHLAMIPPHLIASDFVQQLLSTTRSIVLITDRTGSIVACNRAAIELSGYAEDELRGVDWCERLTVAEHRDRWRARFSLADSELDIRDELSPLHSKSGEIRLISWSVSTIHADDDEHGKLGLLLLGTDVTHEQVLVAKLAESDRLAQIGRMAAEFAHEVGNPLNSMLLQLQVLQRRVARPDPDKPIAPKINLLLAEVRRLSALLDDFRSLRDPNEFQVEPTDVAGVVRDVSCLLSAGASARSVEVECEVDEQLPRVLCSANKLKQVLINLCKNGMEAMPGGGKLRLTAHPECNRVCIEVIDQGPGIPEGVDVFAPFATTKCRGTGLGLPLARDIVNAHAGDLRYVSAPGGTTFTVSLPCS
jgi:PAS domain S-box-containing protein